MHEAAAAQHAPLLLSSRWVVGFFLFVFFNHSKRKSHGGDGQPVTLLLLPHIHPLSAGADDSEGLVVVVVSSPPFPQQCAKAKPDARVRQHKRETLGLPLLFFIFFTLRVK